MTELKEITYEEFRILRFQQYMKQKQICPILKQKVQIEDVVFDHKHKIQTDTLGEDGKGLLRGVIHFQANVMEGKIVKLYTRYGLHKFIALPELLRNIADYIENPPMEPLYIHPNERPKPKKLGKRDFNKICKYYFELYPNRRKLPTYPKSGKISKEFKEILEMISIISGGKKPTKEKLKLRRKNG